MRGAIPLLPNTPSCPGAQFKKTQGQLFLTKEMPKANLTTYFCRLTDVPTVLYEFEKQILRKADIKRM
jgi:hypothetical protein